MENLRQRTQVQARLLLLVLPASSRQPNLPVLGSRCDSKHLGLSQGCEGHGRAVGTEEGM